MQSVEFLSKKAWFEIHVKLIALICSMGHDIYTARERLTNAITLKILLYMHPVEYVLALAGPGDDCVCIFFVTDYDE